MMGAIPIDLKKVRKEYLDREILRTAIIAELDAINLYEQLAEIANNDNIRKVLLEVAREEKTHVGEFLEMLLESDPEQVNELKKGKEEVKEIREEK